MQCQKNPFDRDPQTVPLIRFVLHSTSLTDELLSQSGPAHRLVRLNCFKEIEVIPLPIANDDLRRRFADNGLVSTEYYSHETEVALRVSDGSIHDLLGPFTKRLPDNFWGPIICNSKVTLADLLASNIGDFLIVATTEPSLKRKVAGDNIITAEQALELVRILLTAHNRFYIRPEEPVDEWVYYLYRFRNLYKMFQHAWTIAVYTHGKGLPEKIFDYLDSLSRRLEFICRAYDKIAFFSLKTADNNAQNNQLYHLAYFVMLITGVFDDLAHIIKDFYHLDINERWGVNLRIPQKKKITKFHEALQSRNAKLNAFLTAEDIQCKINAFYPIRDCLQHRELLRGVQYQNFSEGVNMNLFELSDEAAQSLAIASTPPNCVVRVHKACLNPLLFITWAQKVIIELVNRVLSSVNWDSVCETLPEDIQRKIRESDQRFEQGIYKRLRWPEEPWYF